MHNWFLLLVNSAVVLAWSNNEQACKSWGKFDLLGLSKDGDIILGGIFGVHSYHIEHRHLSFSNHPEPAKCLSFRFRSFRFALAMIFAIEEINNNTALLPGVTLGYRLYDSCKLTQLSLKAAMAFLNKPEANTPSANCKSSSTVSAIVADAGSTQTLAIAPSVGTFRIPMIGENVYFDENGDPVPTYDIVNWRPNALGDIDIVNVGHYDGSARSGDEFSTIEEAIVWSGGQKSKAAIKEQEKQEEKGNPFAVLIAYNVHKAKLVTQPLLYYMRTVKFVTKMGEKVYFDENGDPVATYDIVNWQPNALGDIDIVNVGRYDGAARSGEELAIIEEAIVWSSGQKSVRLM
ncbi:hypothetical protein chiPu_0010712 [Chiloscyllium punctatum]|uniref:Receptor ligand binding region domain-containing protein n=1 Tax=Chiloscyllium punctatum TaxID=137246 RepID=A0A401SPE2_CHIPU|nr:hypothetical protein [Chiloscyllium punctatum]